MVATTPLVMVVSVGKKADLQRVGMLSSVREISMYGSKAQRWDQSGHSAQAEGEKNKSEKKTSDKSS